MYLKRIVAERFGRLGSVTLGDLDEGLSVVLGPNEAGKTSFAALVRSVLYGYPRKGSEPGYESSAGKRLGRLVFAEDGNEWAIERTEGTHGGPVAVSTLSGPERAGLREAITEGISREAFRVVFGFGLDEMAQIEHSRGEGLDILSKLSAARVGLGVSPVDVRKSLAERMSKLWLKGGSNPALNQLKSAIEVHKKRLSELEAQAVEYARGREELACVATRLAEARTLREHAFARSRELDAAVQELENLGARMLEIEERAASERAGLEAARSALQEITVDESALAAAPAVSAVLDELSGFKQQLERVRELGPRIEQARADARRTLQEVGADEAAAAAADIGADTLAGLKRWGTRLAGLESRRVGSERAAAIARDAANSGAGGGRLRTDAKRASAGWAPGVVLLALGVVIAGWGVLNADYVQAVLGVLVAGTGAALLLRLRVAGHGGTATLDGLASLESAETAVRHDEEALRTALEEWREWLAARGLRPRSDDPAEAEILVLAFKSYRDESARISDLVASRDAALRVCDAYRDRLASAADGIADDLAAASHDDIAIRAANLRDRVNAAVAAHREREDLARRAEGFERSLKEAESGLVRIRDKWEGLLDARGLAGADAARLKAEQARAAEEAAIAGDAYEEVLREHQALTTRLDGEGRDSEMARVRFELAGLEERRDAALDRYAVLAVAERLIAETQAYSESARQPEVIARASEIFATITGERYVRVVVPSDGGEFVAYDANALATPSSKLSTGAAQQLYLALRIALIESLDGVGPGLPVLMDDVFANFDPERKLGAARAVAELASHRQVVMFTCHPETAALFEEVAPGHTVVSLERL